MVACRMNTDIHTHLPVLLQEVLAHLPIDPNGIYVDATFGRGGHAAEILKVLGPNARYLAFDKDPTAVDYAQQRFAADARFSIHHGSFNTIAEVLKTKNLVGAIDAILFDLGVSSPQLDDAERGFSFMREGTLDMRMNTAQGPSAAEWIATVKEEVLTEILWKYGEEKFSRRIAKAIVNAREVTPIVTTTQLAEIVSAAIPRWEKGKHPATRSFQAIRIAINQELEELADALEQSLEILKINGRLMAISFHSLEDRIVKRFIQHFTKGGDFPPGLPVKESCFRSRLKPIGRAIMPSAGEIAFNPRARSAVLRIAEKLL